MKTIIIFLLLLIPVILIADLGEIRIVSSFDTNVRGDSIDAIVNLGDTFTLQVWANPNNHRVNAVSVFLKYDTNSLLLLDTDENNIWTSDTNIREIKTYYGYILENREPLQGRISYSALTNDEYSIQDTLIAEMEFLAIDTSENSFIIYEFDENKNRQSALVTKDNFESVISPESITPGYIRIIMPEQRDIRSETDPVSGELLTAQENIFKESFNQVNLIVNVNLEVQIFYPRDVIQRETDVVLINSLSEKISQPGLNNVVNIVRVKHESGQNTFSEKIRLSFNVKKSNIKNKNLVIKYSNNESLSLSTNDWFALETNKIEKEDSYEYYTLVNHFTFFGLFDTSLPEPPSDLSNVRVYPNPYVPASNSPAGRDFQHGNLNTGIVFDNLTESSRIFIYTVTGRLVTKSQPLQEYGSLFHWDAKNDNKDDVASGVYIYVIKDFNGNVRTGRLGIVR